MPYFKATTILGDYTAEQVESIGGKRWTKPNSNEVRVYLNGWVDMAGLEIHRYRTGNVSSASLLGVDLSNSAGSRLSYAKLWWQDGALHTDLAARVDDERIAITGAQVVQKLASTIAERIAYVANHKN